MALIGARAPPQPTAEEQDIGEPELEEVEEEHIVVSPSVIYLISPVITK